jgi:hypothetical protein
MAILPLPLMLWQVDDRVMNPTTSLKHRPDWIPVTVHADPGWVRALARIRPTSLDRRLAAGEGAATDRLLAARAHLIVARPGRLRLADDWEHLLTRARQPIVPRSLRLPVQSTEILAAEHQVRELVALIRQPAHVNPRGIALARLLLTDGAGPLHNPRRSADLIPALQAAATNLGCRTPAPAVA